MKAARWRQRLIFPSWLILIIALLALLGSLATLQARWLGQVSEAERERRAAALSASAARFAEDFDRELARAFATFRLDSPSAERGAFELASRYQHWRAQAPFPDLLGEIHLIRQVEEDEPRLLRFDARSARLFEVEWPERFAHLRERFTEFQPAPFFSRRIDNGRPVGGVSYPALAPPIMPPLDAELPGLIIPLVALRPIQIWRGVPRPSERLPASRGCIIIELDLECLRRDLIPALARRHFAGEMGGEEPDYHLTITSRVSPERRIYSSSAAESGTARAYDASVGLFNLRFDLLNNFTLGARTAIPYRIGDQRMRPGFTVAQGMAPAASTGLIANPDQAFWQLSLRHRMGSLEAAVGAVRRRNLAISLAIMALLASSVALLVVSTQRARRLARQQLEFVAGVSHELRTPVSVICMASANLSDGMIRDPEQVERYGTMIHGEGRRLAEMIEQVLAFAGTESIRRPYRFHLLAIDEVIARSLSSAQALAHEKEIEIESEIEEGLPLLAGDAAALERAIDNLLSNALKYGAAGGRVRVSARAGKSRSGSEVLIAVEDSGPGIEAEDLRRIFEPFSRGRAALAAGVPGNGLGLSLVSRIVKAHGGRVAVESAPGRGSRFTLHLPARALTAAHADEKQELRSEQGQEQGLKGYEEARAARRG